MPRSSSYANNIDIGFSFNNSMPRKKTKKSTAHFGPPTSTPISQSRMPRTKPNSRSTTPLKNTNNYESLSKELHAGIRPPRLPQINVHPASESGDFHYPGQKMCNPHVVSSRVSTHSNLLHERASPLASPRKGKLHPGYHSGSNPNLLQSGHGSSNNFSSSHNTNNYRPYGSQRSSWNVPNEVYENSDNTNKRSTMSKFNFNLQKLLRPHKFETHYDANDSEHKLVSYEYNKDAIPDSFKDGDLSKRYPKGRNFFSAPWHVWFMLWSMLLIVVSILLTVVFVVIRFSPNAIDFGERMVGPKFCYYFSWTVYKDDRDDRMLREYVNSLDMGTHGFAKKSIQEYILAEQKRQDALNTDGPSVTILTRLTNCIISLISSISLNMWVLFYSDGAKELEMDLQVTKWLQSELKSRFIANEVCGDIDDSLVDWQNLYFVYVEFLQHKLLGLDFSILMMEYGRSSLIERFCLIPFLIIVCWPFMYSVLCLRFMNKMRRLPKPLKFLDDDSDSDEKEKKKSRNKNNKIKTGKKRRKLEKLKSEIDLDAVREYSDHEDSDFLGRALLGRQNRGIPIVESTNDKSQYRKLYDENYHSDDDNSSSSGYHNSPQTESSMDTTRALENKFKRALGRMLGTSFDTSTDDFFPRRSPKGCGVSRQTTNNKLSRSNSLLSKNESASQIVHGTPSAVVSASIQDLKTEIQKSENLRISRMKYKDVTFVTDPGKSDSSDSNEKQVKNNIPRITSTSNAYTRGRSTETLGRNTDEKRGKSTQLTISTDNVVSGRRTLPRSFTASKKQNVLYVSQSTSSSSSSFSDDEDITVSSLSDEERRLSRRSTRKNSKRISKKVRKLNARASAPERLASIGSVLKGTLLPSIKNGGKSKNNNFAAAPPTFPKGKRSLQSLNHQLSKSLIQAAEEMVSEPDVINDIPKKEPLVNAKIKAKKKARRKDSKDSSSTTNSNQRLNYNVKLTCWQKMRRGPPSLLRLLLYAAAIWIHVGMLFFYRIHLMATDAPYKRKMEKQAKIRQEKLQRDIISKKLLPPVMVGLMPEMYDENGDIISGHRYVEERSKQQYIASHPKHFLTPGSPSPEDIDADLDLIAKFYSDDDDDSHLDDMLNDFSTYQRAQQLLRKENAKWWQPPKGESSQELAERSRVLASSSKGLADNIGEEKSKAGNTLFENWCEEKNDVTTHIFILNPTLFFISSIQL